MKRTWNLLPLLLAVLLCLSPLSAAGKYWDETYYRAIDYSDQLSDPQREELDRLCLDFLSRCKADLVVISTTSHTLKGKSLEHWAREIYQDCGFGYGADHTGFVMAWNQDNDQVILLPIGGAESLIPQSSLDAIAGALAPYRQEQGVYGPLWAATKLMGDYLDQPPDPPETAEAAESRGFTVTDSVNPRRGTDADKPAWYPLDPEHFTKYHDPDAPRVVDVADLIPDDREPALEAQLARLREELNRDVVIFTDVSSYGLSRQVYAADFYDFNGYGVGDDYEGVCLFVCMEEGNRGFWTCCTGTETRALYTEKAANQIDDILYEAMKAGDYAAGLMDWPERFRRLCLTGSPYTPDWAADYDPSRQRTQDPSAPRVVDEAWLLTRDQCAALEARSAELRQRYQTDVVIATAPTSGFWSRQEYADRFYAAHGFGLGGDYDGVLLTVFRTPGSSDTDVLVSCYGAAAERISQTGRARLASRCAFQLDMEEYERAFSNWLNQTDHALKTGRAPRSAVSWCFSALGSALAGAGAAWFLLKRARDQMETPALKEQAYLYLDHSRTQVDNAGDICLKTVTTQRYSPEKTRGSGGGSGSHRSTYSSSYKGSSGTTHSGSGRSF